MDRAIRPDDPAASRSEHQRGNIVDLRTQRQHCRRGWPSALVLIIALLAGCGRPLPTPRPLPLGALTLVGNGTSADGSFAAIAIPPAATAIVRWSADNFATSHDSTPASGIQADGSTRYAFAGDATPLDPLPPTTITIVARFLDGAGTPLGIASATLAYNPAAHTFVDLGGPPTIPENVAIGELADRGIVYGYGDGSGRFGPADRVLRSQAAALVVRSLGWGAEVGRTEFPDRAGTNDELWNSVRVLADRGVARGYVDGTFGPNDPVTEAQVIALITRAMVARGYWVAQPDDPARYQAFPAASGLRSDALTFAHYLDDAGGVPGAGTGWATWSLPATRQWIALALWRATQWREGLLTATALPVARTDPTLVGAGDIAGCDTDGDEATAHLLDRLPGTVFTLGDNAYPNGTPAEYACYDASWGRHLARTRPAPGNHEYYTPGAVGYYGYFGAAAGDPRRGYYSYDLGEWHIVALNSNCAAIGGCGAGSPQETWLRADLAAHPATCTLAYWHQARFSSGSHGSDAAFADLWRALYDGGADVILAGHDHDYERFAPQRADGTRDDQRGIRQIVVGTGGRSHYPVVGTANSEAWNGTTSGVLRLVLHPTSYDWQFVPIVGQAFADHGSARCH